MKKYNEYKKGQKQLVKDERYQIAFRLMDKFKLDTAYSINAESIANDFQSTKDSTLFMPYLQNLYDGYADKDNDNYVKWRDYKTTLTTKISLLKYFATDSVFIEYAVSNLNLSINLNAIW